MWGEVTKKARLIQEDDVGSGRSVGIGFVDLLFALVVGQILATLTTAGFPHVPPVKVLNLSLAAVVTLASWVGYHNSKNRPRYKIQYFNWPMAQFLLDISMVLDYWILATVAGDSARTESYGYWQAGLVSFAFILYSIWDLVVKLIDDQVKSADGSAEGHGSHNLWRRAITWVCTFIALCIWLTSVRVSKSSISVYWIDGSLIALAILFRVAKDREEEWRRKRRNC
jgi:hypothetical protein